MQRTLTQFTAWLLLGLALSLAALQAQAQDGARQEVLDVGGREMTVWSWQPGQLPARGIILFSHGAASAPWKYAPLVSRWLAAGYEVRAPLHVDSTDHPRQPEFTGMTSWTARLQDMRALSQQLGGKPYIAAGHSYGALLALTLGGAGAAVPEGVAAPLADPAVSVVIALSPPPALPGLISKAGYATLARPALIQTGTRDIPMGTQGGWEPHLDAYEAAAAGGERYGLVLDGVDHYFGGAICRPELPGPQQLAELETTADISLLLIHAYAEGNADALAQLQQSLADAGASVLMYK